MTTTIPGIAKFVGKDHDGGNVWDVDGRVYSDEEFDALIARQALQTEAEALVGRELGETLGGLDVQAKADKILRDRGIRPEDATEGEMLDALKRVSQ